MNSEEWFKLASITCKELFTHRKQELIEGKIISNEPYERIISLINAESKEVSQSVKVRAIVSLIMVEAYEHDREIGVILDEFQRGITRKEY